MLAACATVPCRRHIELPALKIVMWRCWMLRCVVDYKPHKFDAECCNILANFAEMVVRDVERYAALEQRADEQRWASLEQVCTQKANDIHTGRVTAVLLVRCENVLV